MFVHCCVQVSELTAWCYHCWRWRSSCGAAVLCVQRWVGGALTPEGGWLLSLSDSPENREWPRVLRWHDTVTQSCSSKWLTTKAFWVECCFGEWLPLRAPFQCSEMLTAAPTSTEELPSFTAFASVHFSCGSMVLLTMILESLWKLRL